IANMCYVPIQPIIDNKFGIRVSGIINKYCHVNNYIIPYNKNNTNNECCDTHDNKTWYEGSCVITPEKKLYNKPVVVIDYNSLYPTIIINQNLSHEYYVNDSRYDN